MITVVDDSSTGVLFLDHNGERTPVESAAHAALLRALSALVTKADAAADPEALFALFKGNLPRLLRRSVATLVLQAQETSDDVQEAQEQPASFDDHVVVARSEIRLVLPALFSALTTLNAVAAQVKAAADADPNNAAIVAQADDLARTSAVLGGFTTRLAFAEESAGEDDEDGDEPSDGQAADEDDDGDDDGVEA